MQLDSKYELKFLRFRKDKFELKIYDAKNKQGSTVEIPVPEQYRRIATVNFGFLNCGSYVVMNGGLFSDDKTCSGDSYRIDVECQILEDMDASLKLPRMHHSMILIEEKGQMLVVGGEDDQGNLLDQCEILDVKENVWRSFSALNNKGKQIGLCKFTKDNKRYGEKILLLYAFNKTFIERVNLNKFT
jgi:hypothetical protein